MGQAVEEDAGVRLVGEQQRIAARERGRDQVEIVRAEDVAGRVHRCVHDRERRLGADRGRECRPVRCPVGAARHGAGPAGLCDHLREEERRGMRDRPRAEGLRRQVEALHPAERDQHLPVGIDPAPELGADAVGDRLAQRRQASRRRVGGAPGGLRCRLDDVRRHVDRRVAADRDQAGVALPELARGHRAGAGHTRSLFSSAT